MASYLRIPVIVTDEVDSEVTELLADLGVEKTMVCGENIDGYGDVLKFYDAEEIVDVTIEYLLDTYGEIDYITLTNPIDACSQKSWIV